MKFMNPKQFIEFLAPFAFIVFSTIGNFKATDLLKSLPIDATIICAVSVILIMSFYIIYSNFRLFPRNELFILLLPISFFLAMLFSLVQIDLANAYGISKAAIFFSLSFLCFIFPILMIRSTMFLRRYFLSYLIIQILVILGLSSELLLNRDALRVSSLGSSTIATGRNICYFLISIIYLISFESNGFLKVRQIFRVKAVFHTVKIVFLLSLCFFLLVAGSKGPILFLGLSLFITLLVSSKNVLNTLRKSINAVVIVLVILFPLTLLTNFLPQGSLTRFENFLRLDFGDSETTRIDAIKISIEEILSNPQGIGFGDFNKLGVFDALPPEEYSDRQYPHNLIVEITLENGWLSGVLYVLTLILAVILAAKMIKKTKENPMFVCFFCYLIFAILNSQVSGELNDERILFGLIAMSFPLYWITHSESKKNMYGVHYA